MFISAQRVGFREVRIADVDVQAANVSSSDGLIIVPTAERWPADQNSYKVPHSHYPKYVHDLKKHLFGTSAHAYTRTVNWINEIEKDHTIRSFYA